MSEERNVAGRSYFKNSNSARNISRPYDKRQSILSRLKNAVKGYFSPPSWIQAVIPPGTVDDEQMNDEGCKTGIDQTKPNGHGFDGHGKREYKEIAPGNKNELKRDIEVSSSMHDDYKEKGLSLKRSLSSLNSDIKTSKKKSKEEDLQYLEPQSKRQALEDVIDTQRKSIFSKKLAMKNESVIDESLVGRSELSRIKGNDLSIMKPSMTLSQKWGSPGLAGHLSGLEKSSSQKWGNSGLGGHEKYSSNFKSSAKLFSVSYSEKDKSHDLSLSSPFYKGPITYGGANAFQLSATSEIKNDEDNHRVVVAKKQSNLGLSSTTQKILKVLEKRVSSCESDEQFRHNPGLPPLTFVSMKGRYMVTDGTCVQGPPLKQIQTPSRLTIKPNYSLLIASSSNESTTDGSATGATKTDSQKWTGKMKSDKRHHTKANYGKQEEITSKDNQSELSHIKLPLDTRVHFMKPSVPVLPATEAATSYKFSHPTPITPRTCSSNHTSAHVKSFKFSDPEVKNRSGFQSVEGAAASLTASQEKNGVATSAMSSSFSLSREEPSGALSSLKLNSFTVDYNSAIKKSPTNKVLDVQPAKELRKGSVMDILNRQATSSIDSATDKSLTEKGDVPLNMLFKEKAGSCWECPTCMVSNKNEITTCPCCSAVKPTTAKTTTSSSSINSLPSSTTSSVNVTSQTSSNIVSTLSYSVSSKQVLPSLLPTSLVVTTSAATQNSVPLNMLFKQSTTDKWKCQTCMVENETSLASCPCCSEPRPRSSAVSSVLTSTSQNSAPLSVLFQQASAEKWNCPTCMVANSSSLASCPCCLEPKPGSSAMPNALTSVPPLIQSDLTKNENSLSALFTIKPGEWKCDTCFVQNKADSNKCVACETTKPGSLLKSSDANKEAKKTYDVPSTSAPFIDAVSGGFKFPSALNFNASDFGNNKPKDMADSSQNKGAQNNAISFGGFKPSFGTFGSSSKAEGVSSSGTGVSGGFKFVATSTKQLPSFASAVASTSIPAFNSILTSSTQPVSSVPQNLFSFSTSPPTSSSNLFPAVQATISSVGYSFGQSVNPNSSSSSLFQENQNNSSSQSIFNLVRNDGLSSNPFSSGTSSTESTATSVATFKFGSSTLTNGVSNSANPVPPVIFSTKAVAPSSTPQIAFSGMFGAKQTQPENKLPAFQFGTNQASSFGAGHLGNTTNQSALSFGGPVSSSSVVFGQNVGAAGQQSTASFFGAQNLSSSSFNHQQQNVAIVTTQSPFSFNQVTSSTPLFGNSNSLVGGTQTNLNFNATRQISVDMMADSDSNNQSPVPSMFGTGSMNSTSNQPAFGFTSNSNGSNVPLVGSSKPTQGFSFNSSAAPAFNFSQQPTFAQQVSQSWNQPPQQNNAPPPTFAFSANPNFNFSGSNETSNVAFSSAPAPGAPGASRTIKRGVRRITKK